MATRRPAHNTPHPHEFLVWFSLKRPQAHVDRRVVGWCAGRHVDRPFGRQISKWPVRKITYFFFKAVKRGLFLQTKFCFFSVELCDPRKNKVAEKWLKSRFRANSRNRSKVGPKVGFLVEGMRKPTFGPTFDLFREFARNLLLSYFSATLFFRGFLVLWLTRHVTSQAWFFSSEGFG